MVAVASNIADTPDVGGIKILGTGVVVMLSLLPMVRSAGLFFASQSRPIMVATLVLEAGLSIMMLMGRIRCQHKRRERHLAATFTRAVRTGAWE